MRECGADVKVRAPHVEGGVNEIVDDTVGRPEKAKTFLREA